MIILSLMACAVLGLQSAVKSGPPKSAAPTPMTELQELLSRASDASSKKAFVSELMVFQGKTELFLQEHKSWLDSTQPMDQNVRRYFGLPLIYVAPAAIYALQKDDALDADLHPVLALNQGKIMETDLNNRRFSRPLYDYLVTQFELQKSVQQFRHDLQFKGELLIVTSPKVPSETIRQLMYNAGLTQFTTFKFIFESTDCHQNSQFLKCDESHSTLDPLTELHLQADDMLRYVQVELPRVPVVVSKDRIDSSIKISVREDGIRIFGVDNHLSPKEIHNTPEGKAARAVIPCAKKACTQLNDFNWGKLSTKLTTIKKAAQKAGIRSQPLHIWTQDALSAEILLKAVTVSNEDSQNLFFPIAIVGADPEKDIKE